MAIYLGLSPILPPVPLDMTCDDHREAWSRYEAEREYETWQNGEDYAPTPTATLWLYGGKITHVIEVPGQYVPTTERSDCGKTTTQSNWTKNKAIIGPAKITTETETKRDRQRK